VSGAAAVPAGRAPAGPPGPGAGLDGDVRVQRGALSLRVPLAVAPGTTTAVLGPNGAGKTTLLRAVAGLEPLDGGHLRIGGTAVDDPGAGVFVPPERRQVGLAPQAHVLFGHLSALDNVAFGPRCRGAGRGEARRRAREVLGRMGLADLATARPHQLSGGQSQRVALARALAGEPRVLLLDEPLASLDAALRPAMRAELRRWLSAFGGATVVVTHDPLDAHALADELVVLEHGVVTQAGPLAEVTSRPRSRYVADLVGTNLLQGRAAGHELHVGPVVVHLAEAAQGEVFCTLAPAAIAVAARGPGQGPPPGSARNHWAATVVGLEPMGERVRVVLAGDLDLVAELTAASVAELGLAPGAEVWATAKATEVRAFPR